MKLNKLMSRTLPFALIGLGIVFVTPQAFAAKVEICHKEKRTLRVSDKALPAHKAHGDFMGKCDEVRSETLLLSCAVTAPDHLVTAVSTSTQISTEIDFTTVVVAGANCAEALNAVVQAGCETWDTFGAPDAQTYSFTCPSESAVIPEQ